MPARLGRVALALASVAIVCGVAFASLPSLLTVSDQLPASADAIFVFPGDAPERQRCAAELYRRGLAPVVVFSGGVVRGEVAALGQPLTEAEIGARVARDAGIPEAAMVVLPRGTSTWEDAETLRDWVAATGARRVVAVTSALHSRRARRSAQIALESLATDFRLLACGPRLAPTSGWWLEERPLVMVTNEALKLALYGVRHFAPHLLGGAPHGRSPAGTP